MKFEAQGTVDHKIHLTIEAKGHGSDEVFLMANGEVIMGFYEGKFRLYSGGSGVEGLSTNEHGLVQCHNPKLVT